MATNFQKKNTQKKIPLLSDLMYQMQSILYPNDKVWKKDGHKKYVMGIYKDLTQEEILKNWETLETRLIELATIKNNWVHNFFNRKTNAEQLDSSIDWKKVPRVI